MEILASLTAALQPLCLPLKFLFRPVTCVLFARYTLMTVQINAELMPNSSYLYIERQVTVINTCHHLCQQVAFI